MNFTATWLATIAVFLLIACSQQTNSTKNVTADTSLELPTYSATAEIKDYFKTTKSLTADPYNWSLSEAGKLKDQLKNLQDIRIQLEKELAKITKSINSTEKEIATLQKLDELNHDIRMTEEHIDALQEAIRDLEKKVGIINDLDAGLFRSGRSHRYYLEDKKSALARGRLWLKREHENRKKFYNQNPNLKMLSKNEIDQQLALIKKNEITHENDANDVRKKIASLDSEIKTIELRLKNKSLKDGLSNPEQFSWEENDILYLRDKFLNAKKELLDKISKGGEIDLNDVAQALTLKHFIHGSPKKIEFQKYLDNFKSIAKTVEAIKIEEKKPSYEADIAESFFNGDPLKYNKKNSNITDLLLKNRMQCYSGTLTHLLVDVLSFGDLKHSVVILTPGHVMSGYITVEEDHFSLWGVETTAAGKALVKYGPTSAIKGDIRVFNATQFLLVELFKEDLVSFSNLYSRMLETMTKYNFKTNNFFPYDNETASKAIVSLLLNSSPLGFGESQVPDGDIERESFDILDKTSSALSWSGIFSATKEKSSEVENYYYLCKGDGQKERKNPIYVYFMDKDDREDCFSGAGLRSINKEKYLGFPINKILFAMKVAGMDPKLKKSFKKNELILEKFIFNTKTQDLEIVFKNMITNESYQMIKEKINDKINDKATNFCYDEFKSERWLLRVVKRGFCYPH